MNPYLGGACFLSTDCALSNLRASLLICEYIGSRSCMMGCWDCGGCGGLGGAGDFEVLLGPGGTGGAARFVLGLGEEDDEGEAAVSLSDAAEASSLEWKWLHFMVTW